MFSAPDPAASRGRRRPRSYRACRPPRPAGPRAPRGRVPRSLRARRRAPLPRRAGAAAGKTGRRRYSRSAPVRGTPPAARRPPLRAAWRRWSAVVLNAQSATRSAGETVQALRKPWIIMLSPFQKRNRQIVWYGRRWPHRGFQTNCDRQNPERKALRVLRMLYHTTAVGGRTSGGMQKICAGKPKFTGFVHSRRRALRIPRP